MYIYVYLVKEITTVEEIALSTLPVCLISSFLLVLTLTCSLMGEGTIPCTYALFNLVKNR